jgi:hypothetical protein
LPRTRPAAASAQLDTQAVGTCLMRKEAQDPPLKLSHETAFELD